MSEFNSNVPTERIDLPSKGLVYPKESVLSQGFVEIKIPTAKQEDILTNVNYLRQGIATEKFLESILVTSGVKLDDMIAGDKDAVQVAARVLGYGKEYVFMEDGQKITVDLTTMEETILDESSMITPHVNEFSFDMPVGKVNIKFKLLTGNDQKLMNKEIEGMRKGVNKDYSADITTLFYYTIVEVDGKRDSGSIRRFVDNMLMVDSKAFRKHIGKIAPGYNWVATGKTDTGEVLEGLSVPYTADFFWPRD